MGTLDDMEQPAKQWQLKGVNDQLQAVNEKLDSELKTVNSKLDVVIAHQNGYVTQADLAKEIDGVHKEIEAKYGPLYKVFWALLTGVIVQAAYLVMQLLGQQPKG